jgi:hypothetical protein
MTQSPDSSGAHRDGFVVLGRMAFLV